MLYALILLALLSLGCSKKKEAPSAEPAKTETPAEAPRAEPSSAETASDPDAFPEEGAPPKLELSTAGEEPRRVLRWNFKGSSTYSLQMRAQETMRLEMDLQDEELQPITNPPIVYELSLQTREVTDDGTARVDFRVTGARAEKSKAVSAVDLALLTRELSALRGLRGTYTVDAYGLLSDIEFDRASAKAQQATLEKLSQMLHWTTVPLPREPVGKGAAWTVRQVLLQDGAKVRQRSEVELLEVEGAVVELAVNIEKSASRQKLSSAGDAETYELLQLKSSESLQTRADLDQLVPSACKATGKVEMATRMDGPDGGAEEVRATVDLQGSLRGSRVTD